MNPHLRVLIVEDSEDDRLLMLRELRRLDDCVESLRVETAAQMQAALDRESWDLILSDYSLPAFNAPEALQLMQRNRLDLPFIIVSGTIGEETAVAAMKAGAHDYLSKSNLARLVPAIERELRDAEERRKRKQAEQALLESEERWQFALEGNGDGLYDWNAETNEVYHSPRWKEMLGYAEPDIGVALSEWESRLHPDDKERVFAELQKHLNGETTQYTSEHRMLCKDGSYKWVLDRGRVMSRTADGKPLRMIGTHSDISDRKQAEEALHLQSHALASAVEGIAQLDVQGLYVAVNAAYADLLGYQTNELIGLPWQQTVHPADQPKMAIAYQHMLDEGKVDVECRGVRKDGSTFYKQIMMVTSFSQEQHRVGHYCFVKDITERKQAEEKIREQANLLEITADAISVRDLDHHILFWNKGAEHLYGWQASEVLGRNALELLYRPEDIQIQLPMIQEALGQNGEWQGELSKVAKDGHMIVVQSRWTLMRDDAGQPKSILAVSTDITEKKQLESQVFRAQRLESLGTLASGVAHDFNNILTPILAASQLLPMKIPQLDEANRQLLQLIESSTKRGAALVKQILAFARGVEGTRMPLYVQDVLTEAIQVIRQTFPKTIELVTDTSAAGQTLVSADATQLQQVLMNLCVNARDAMPFGGTLRLSVQTQDLDAAYTRTHLEAHTGSYVVITVSDTGTGISTALLDRIFDPFFTTKETGQGTGLGLSTVLGIVKNHEGFVQVESTVGQGTQFQVFIPAIADMPVPPIAGSPITVGNQELILIVDDEPLIQQVTQTTLESHGYKTLVAKDGAEAISVYAQRQQDIQAVLMDIMMPGMDGLTAIRAMQRLNPKVKVIAASGLSSNSQLAERANVKAFLAKPYTAQELLDTLQQVVKVVV
jgi:PAS domain S-box-containing protein